jgi:hypothetical protein
MLICGAVFNDNKFGQSIIYIRPSAYRFITWQAIKDESSLNILTNFLENAMKDD